MLSDIPSWLESVTNDVTSLWPLYMLVAAILAALRAGAKMMERVIREVVTPVDERVIRIESEFTPNGGDSMRDRQEHILCRLTSIMEMLSHHDTALDVLWETAPEALYVSGKDGLAVKANQAYLNLWGFTDPAQAYTTEWVTQLTPEAQVLAGERVAQMFGGDTHPPFVFDLERLDGRTFRVVGKPIRSEGEWEGYAGVVLDLSSTTMRDVEHHLTEVEHEIQDHVAWEERKYDDGYRKGQEDSNAE